MIYILSRALNTLFSLLQNAIIIDVILSWFYRGRGNKFIDILHIFTEPFMAPGRRIQERLMPNMMLDFSPIIAIFIIRILQFLTNSVLGMLTIYG